MTPGVSPLCMRRIESIAALIVPLELFKVGPLSDNSFVHSYSTDLPGKAQLCAWVRSDKMHFRNIGSFWRIFKP